MPLLYLGINLIKYHNSRSPISHEISILVRSVMMQKESDRGSDEDNGWHDEGGDEEVNDELENLVDSVKKIATIPPKLEASIKFGYDDGAKTQLNGQDFDSFIQGVMVHVQSYYQHSESLGTEIHFEV